MLDDVLAIPDHLRDALWRVESARLPRGESAGVLVCGMGGSAVGGDLAAAALGARRVIAGTGGALTEAARAAGDPVIGLPGLLLAPRSAVAYMLVCALEVAAAAGIAPRLGDEIEAAAALLEASREDLRYRAAEIATAVGDRVPVVYGAGPTTAAARRWKTQINENAKLPAFFSELPEADHNEICSWEAAAALPLAAVLLEDRDQHPREQLRFELTAAEIERGGPTAVRIEAAGESRTERLLWQTMLGDLVSLELASMRQVDPLPIEAIDRLKASLSG